MTIFSGVRAFQYVLLRMKKHCFYTQYRCVILYHEAVADQTRRPFAILELPKAEYEASQRHLSAGGEGGGHKQKREREREKKKKKKMERERERERDCSFFLGPPLPLQEGGL